ncbi:MAG TPA: glycosyltransferase family 4 protein [Ramlibacter sp.]|nr:glycosyltransferase family 4 protein [Ramlibacter sp.]
MDIKVFYTWQADRAPVFDPGFQQHIAWDIPLTQGYEFEAVSNTSRDPGTHHFFGLTNPGLVEQVLAWKPHAVHVTGWAWHSHLLALRRLRAIGVPVLFRGDSHLLDAPGSRLRAFVKRALLRRVFSWPTVFLYTGQANKAYFEAFGVPPEKLSYCPHSIDVDRFARPAADLESQARRWRHELGITDEQKVVLFAGKFEPRKRPLELMKAVLAHTPCVLIMVGGGELQPQVESLAATAASRVRVLGFQNQATMPVVYRMGDVFVLPSAHGETWGLAVNEALACGRPVVVSDRVGCAADVIDDSCGRTFPVDGVSDMIRAVQEIIRDSSREALRRGATARSMKFDIARTETSLLHSLHALAYAR